MDTPRPFLKWVGGKGRSIEPILAALPPVIDTYHEPFLGGGAVFFALARKGRFKRAILSDLNQELIDTYIAIRSDVGAVVSILRSYEYHEGLYYWLRSLNPLDLTLAERAARMIYLNKCGFNGLYRVNKKGEFNVPFGRHVDPTICDEENLRAVSESLQRVSILRVGFPASMSAVPGDAVYYDPPYAPVSPTANFTAYTADGFGLAQHIDLADCFGTLRERGVDAVLSNSDTLLTRELYSEWEIKMLKVGRTVSAGKRKPVSEILARNVHAG